MFNKCICSFNNNSSNATDKWATRLHAPWHPDCSIRIATKWMDCCSFSLDLRVSLCSRQWPERGRNEDEMENLILFAVSFRDLKLSSPLFGIVWRIQHVRSAQHLANKRSEELIKSSWNQQLLHSCFGLRSLVPGQNSYPEKRAINAQTMPFFFSFPNAIVQHLHLHVITWKRVFVCV